MLAKVVIRLSKNDDGSSSSYHWCWSVLLCAPSNNAIDNVIMKVMESGLVDGNGST